MSENHWIEDNVVYLGLAPVQRAGSLRLVEGADNAQPPSPVRRQMAREIQPLTSAHRQRRDERDALVLEVDRHDRAGVRGDPVRGAVDADEAEADARSPR